MSKQGTAEAYSGLEKHTTGFPIVCPCRSITLPHSNKVDLITLLVRERYTTGFPVVYHRCLWITPNLQGIIYPQVKTPYRFPRRMPTVTEVTMAEA